MRAPREQFHTLLVGTDLSECADDAVARATQLPLASSAVLTLVHVLPWNIPKRWRRQVESEAQRSLEQAASATAARLRSLGRDDVGVTSMLATGEPYAEIIRRSRTLNADLVVVGRHGRRPFRDLFIGSTAMRVVRMGDVPVLVVGTRPHGRYQQPVLATDREDVSLRLVDMIAKATEPGVPVALVSAYDLPSRYYVELGTDEHPTEPHRHYRDAAMRQLASFVSCSQKSGIEWIPILRWGDPRPVILEVAKERKADLIVLGTHARSGITQALLGSVTEFVLEDASCDVLVARIASSSSELPDDGD